MTILDANVWIAYFHAPDSQHAKARRVFSTVLKPILIPEYVIIEVCTILERLAGHSIMLQFLEIALGNKEARVVPMSDEAFFDLLKNISANLNHPLSFIDVCLLRFSGIYQVITFDKKLATEIKKTGRRRPA